MSHILQDNDGNIEADEYQAQMNNYGFDLTLEQAQSVLDKADLNSDGIVTYIGKMYRLVFIPGIRNPGKVQSI